MQPAAQSLTKESALESFSNLCTGAGIAANQLGIYYTATSQYAGKYWVYVKEHEAEITKGALFALFIPLLYYRSGSVGLGAGCTLFAPQVLPALQQKVVDIWKDTNLGKLVLIGGGIACAKFDVLSLTAFSYGAYLGSCVRPPVYPTPPVPEQLPEQRLEEKLEQKLEQKLKQMVDQKLEKKPEPKTEPTTMSWVWGSVFGSKSKVE